ncbi:Belongs to the TRAFAC class myosin-kinesin ATPase super [Homalodisca vitripennis]|nr:Belongs to the TRAFAC class myosin-kinesin ATPase super [Homalodisca vitripennis]
MPALCSIQISQNSSDSSFYSPLQEQLNNLMTTLRSTQPHFVRCIIPNELKQPGVIDSHLVMHQLTCNGVLEGIRICRKGFPNRMVYPDFKQRYMILAPATMAAEADPKIAASKCLEEIKLDPESYRIGHTKACPRIDISLISPCIVVAWVDILTLHDRYKILCPAVVNKVIANEGDDKKVCEAVLDEVKLNAESYRLGHTKACVLSRYKILNAKGVTPTMSPEQAAKAILESIPSLDPEQYRMGHTKPGSISHVKLGFLRKRNWLMRLSWRTDTSLIIRGKLNDAKSVARVRIWPDSFLDKNYYVLGVFFRAGVLGQMEELRDDRLGKIMGWMQSYIRGYLSRKEFKKLQEQRLALQVVQRNLRKYLSLRTWPWWKMWQKVKPLLNVTNVEEEMRKLEEKVAKAEEAYKSEVKVRKECEALNAKLLEEKTNLLKSLEGEKGELGQVQERANKLSAQKADLESQLQRRGGHNLIFAVFLASDDASPASRLSSASPINYPAFALHYPAKIAAGLAHTCPPHLAPSTPTRRY